MWRVIRSYLYLAVAFWRRRWKRLRHGREDDGGAQRFLENFTDEGLAPLTAGHEALLRDLGRCIHCGLCEAVCPLPVDRWPVYSRAIAMAQDAAASMAPRCPDGCQKCVTICPTGVPLAQIPVFVNRATSDS